MMRSAVPFPDTPVGAAMQQSPSTSATHARCCRRQCRRLRSRYSAQADLLAGLGWEVEKRTAQRLGWPAVAVKRHWTIGPRIAQPARLAGERLHLDRFDSALLH